MKKFLIPASLVGMVSALAAEPAAPLIDTSTLTGAAVVMGTAAAAIAAVSIGIMVFKLIRKAVARAF